MRGEQWHAVAGYEGRYEVSDRGRVKSLPRKYQPRVLILRPGRKRGHGEHLHVALRDGSGAMRSFTVHVLVLRAFVGPCPPGLECCHNDGDASNNRVENLRWDTGSENTYDQVRHGRHHQVVKTRCPRDHEYTPENTRVYSGRRFCRTCQRQLDASRSRS